MNINKLVFNNSDAALNYAEKFFKMIKLKKDESYYGIVRHIDATKQPTLFSIEIALKNNSLFSSKIIRQLVIGIRHPEMKSDPIQSDLVIWGCTDKKMKIPTGYVLYLLKSEFNAKTETFEFK